MLCDPSEQWLAEVTRIITKSKTFGMLKFLQKSLAFVWVSDDLCLARFGNHHLKK